MTALEARIADILRTNTYSSQISTLDDGRPFFTYSIDTYRPDVELDKNSLKKIMNNDNPMDSLREYLDESLMDGLDLARENLIEFVMNALNNAYSHTEVVPILDDMTSFTYDIDDFNIDYNVDIMLDVGDSNFDFSNNNVLNYYADWSADIKEPSSMLWLAKQQGKDKELIEALKQYKNNGIMTDDKFLASMIQEFENNTCGCSSVVFLVTMKLFDIINIKRDISAKRLENHILTVKKDAMCGLYDGFQGGGSVLDVYLDKDVAIPYEYLYDVCIDGTGSAQYDVQDVYGFTDKAWESSASASIVKAVA